MIQQKKQAKSYRASDKTYKYYLFYSTENGSLYAYTDNKTLAKAFYETREKSIFLYQERMLDSSVLKEIHDEVPDALIEPYIFHMKNMDITIPITLREKLELEHTVIQTVSTSIYCSAKINPEIFSDKVRKSLDVLHYSSVYNEYHDGFYNMESLKADYLTCFLVLFGKTMKRRW